MKIITTIISILLISIAMGISAQNAPVVTVEEVTTVSSDANVALTTTGFTEIFSFNMKILYDPAIAKPTGVTVGSGLGGNLAVNLNNSGEIILSWYSDYDPVSLADGSGLVIISFDRQSLGTTTISFDNNGTYDFCRFYDASFQELDDAAGTYFSGSLTFNEHVSPLTVAPGLTACVNDIISIPITVTGFNNIGAVSLAFQFDPGVLEYISAENTAGFPGLFINNPVSGIISAGGNYSGADGISFSGTIVLYTVNFRYLGGSTDLAWFDNGTSCEYAGPASSAYNVLPDTPQEDYYIDGSVGPCTAAPTITVGTVTNPTTCGGNDGTIPLTFTNVPDGTYTITYDDDGSFTGVEVSELVATITGVSAGTYSNLQITVGDNTSALGVNVVLIDHQDPEPVTECWETASWNAVTCSWDVTGTKPTMPDPVNCWDVFEFNTTTCVWDNVGVEPLEPTAENCWDDYHFDTNTCTWENLGSQPEEPDVECYQTATWNATSCSWDVTGTQPDEPATECWETASWNAVTCSWDVTGTKPTMPDPVNCWDVFEFNTTTCVWDNVGVEPLEPTAENCWDDYHFDTNTCTWENLGSQPVLDIVSSNCSSDYQYYSIVFESNATVSSTAGTVDQSTQTVTGIPAGTDVTLIATSLNGCKTELEVTAPNCGDCPDIEIFSITASTSDPVEINTPVEFSILYSSEAPVNITVQWGDETDETYEEETNGELVVSHNYSETGVYTVTVIAANSCGTIEQEVYNYVVVYNKYGGFVIGAGCFYSSPGAYLPDPTLEGYAKFGFLAKYVRGISKPIGGTEFMFCAGNLRFRSANYEWLVTTGVGTALFKGTGTINGKGNYGFLIVAVDGMTYFRNKFFARSKNSDELRVVIWDNDNGGQIIYDNVYHTEISCGSIVVNPGANKSGYSEQDPVSYSISDVLEGVVGSARDILEQEINSMYGLTDINMLSTEDKMDLKVYPNPFTDRLKFEFVSQEDGETKIEIFDVNGRLVETIFNEYVWAGIRYKVEFIPADIISDFYFYKVEKGEKCFSGKIIFNK